MLKLNDRLKRAFSKVSKLVIIYISIILALGSCTVGDDYKRPSLSVDEKISFINKKDEGKSPVSNVKWWEQINDPALNKYIEKLIADNLSLKQATARISQAQARLSNSKGANLPTLSASLSGSRNSTIIQGFGDSLQPVYFTNYTAQLQSSWELDLFGRIRRSVESANSAFEASIYDREAIAHSLIAELVNRRVAIAVNKKLLELAKNNLDNRKKIYDLTRKRYDLGVARISASDVLLTQENYTTIKADVGEFERRLKDEQYMFDILLGKVPGSTDFDSEDFAILPPPMKIVTCVPASLLDRRPDLKASELRLKAANADIGVAIADLYPQINLSGNIGFLSDSFGTDIINTDRIIWSIMGSITSRIFEGGRLRANIRLQKAEAEELTSQYAENVLNAIGEVESALKAEEELKKEVEALNESVDSIVKATKISEDRYRRGVIALKELLDTEQRKYQIEQLAILRGQQKWNARIALYLALGGDWFSDESQKEEC